jgi:hypothetical protein
MNAICAAAPKVNPKVGFQPMIGIAATIRCCVSWPGSGLGG